MRIEVGCFKCFFDDPSPHNIVPQSILEINDEDVYYTICDLGHKQATVVQGFRFEFLFELGCYAYIDGYYREAITCFHAALERFYEFYIRVHAIHKGINEKEIEKFWKVVCNQSERQFGAYLICYLSDRACSAPVLSDASVKLRNAVVHKGKIPTKLQAMKFGEQVLEILSPQIDFIKRERKSSLGKLTMLSQIEKHKKVDTEYTPVFLANSTAMCMAVDAGSEPFKNLNALIEHLTKRAKRFNLAKSG